MTSSPELGAHRKAADLSPLTVDQMLPLDPMEIADSMSIETIRSRAMGQYALVAGLTEQRNELDARLEFEMSQLARWREALQLADDKNPGSPQ